MVYLIVRKRAGLGGLFVNSLSTPCEKPGQLEWAGKTHGAYILRTNTDCEDPAELWRWHIQFTEAESAFLDLNYRPTGELGLMAKHEQYDNDDEKNADRAAADPDAMGTK